MFKLLLTSSLILFTTYVHSVSRVNSYWQEYGLAATVPLPAAQSLIRLPMPPGDRELRLVIANSDPLAVSVISDFLHLALVSADKPIIVQPNKDCEFAHITQPIGLAAALAFNQQQLEQIMLSAVPELPNTYYVALTDFVDFYEQQAAIYQLITLNYQGRFYAYPSQGIAIDHKFYTNYLQIAHNRGQAYTMAYALEHAYALANPHWQLSVTNYKLSKLTHLKTALDY